MGRRVLEQLNLDLRTRTKTITDVWLPSWVRDDFRKRLGLEDNFQFFEKIGIAKVHEVAEAESFDIDGAKIRAFRMAQPELASYLVEYGKKRILLALDETKDWKPRSELLEPDILVMETGWFESSPQGEQIVPTGHWIRQSEASFEETLDLVQKIKPQLALLTHIEEHNRRSYADYLKLEQKYKEYRLRFAFDGLNVQI
jgi:phosphoribosyl 1,2-cyclic phosphate phosphodiesterase